MTIPPVPSTEATKDVLPVPVGGDPDIEVGEHVTPDAESEAPESYVDDVEGGAPLASDPS